MLVLTRKNNEGMLILDEEGNILARVVIVKATQGKAQVGIEADPQTKILREELYEGEEA